MRCKRIRDIKKFDTVLGGGGFFHELENAYTALGKSTRAVRRLKYSKKRFCIVSTALCTQCARCGFLSSAAGKSCSPKEASEVSRFKTKQRRPTQVKERLFAPLLLRSLTLGSAGSALAVEAATIHLPMLWQVGTVVIVTFEYHAMGRVKNLSGE